MGTARRGDHTPYVDRVYTAGCVSYRKRPINRGRYSQRERRCQYSLQGCHIRQLSSCALTDSQKTLTRQAVLERLQASQHATKSTARNDTSLVEHTEPNTQRAQNLERKVLSATCDARSVLRMRNPESLSRILQLRTHTLSMRVTVLACKVAFTRSQCMNGTGRRRSEAYFADSR